MYVMLYSYYMTIFLIILAIIFWPILLEVALILLGLMIHATITIARPLARLFGWQLSALHQFARRIRARYLKLRR